MIRFLISLCLLISAVYLGQTIAQVRVGPYEQSPGLPLGEGLYYDKSGKLSLTAGSGGQTAHIAQMVRQPCTVAIAHGFTGTLVLTTNTALCTINSVPNLNPEYSFTSALLQPGDWGWIEQGASQAIDFVGSNVVGTTTTTGQYSRFMWYFDGTKVSIK